MDKFVLTLVKGLSFAKQILQNREIDNKEKSNNARYNFFFLSQIIVNYEVETWRQRSSFLGSFIPLGVS